MVNKIKANKIRRVMKISLVFLLSMSMMTGLFLSLTGNVKGRIRQKYSNKAIFAVEEAIRNEEPVSSFMVPVTGALAIEGENGETEFGLDGLMEEMRDLSFEYESLPLLGILEVPCIGVKEPIWDSCSANALRYGVGRYPGTAEIGGEGLCNLFGHRQIGEPDIKLGSIQYLAEMTGETVTVTTTDGSVHEYMISDTVYVTDSELMPYLNRNTFDREVLCITACGWGEDPLTGNCYPRNTEFVVICESK